MRQQTATLPEMLRQQYAEMLRYVQTRQRVFSFLPSRTWVSVWLMWYVCSTKGCGCVVRRLQGQGTAMGRGCGVWSGRTKVCVCVCGTGGIMAVPGKRVGGVGAGVVCGSGGAAGKVWQGGRLAMCGKVNKVVVVCVVRCVGAVLCGVCVCACGVWQCGKARCGGCVAGAYGVCSGEEGNATTVCWVTRANQVMLSTHHVVELVGNGALNARTSINVGSHTGAMPAVIAMHHGCPLQNKIVQSLSFFILHVSTDAYRNSVCHG